MGGAFCCGSCVRGVKNIFIFRVIIRFLCSLLWKRFSAMRFYVSCEEERRKMFVVELQLI